MPKEPNVCYGPYSVGETKERAYQPFEDIEKSEKEDSSNFTFSKDLVNIKLENPLPKEGTFSVQSLDLPLSEHGIQNLTPMFPTNENGDIGIQETNQ